MLLIMFTCLNQARLIMLEIQVGDLETSIFHFFMIFVLKIAEDKFLVCSLITQMNFVEWSKFL